MSFAALADAVKRANDQIEQVTRSAERMKSRLDAVRSTRRNSELDNLMEQPLFQSWLDLVFIDANHPDLKLHENLMRWMLNIDTGVLLDIKKLARDRQKRKRRQPGSRDPFWRALDQDEAQALLDEYRGAA